MTDYTVEDGRLIFIAELEDGSAGEVSMPVEPNLTAEQQIADYIDKRNQGIREIQEWLSR